jgi:hypothetical protein
VSDRPTASEITDDQLDDLYARLDAIRAFACRLANGTPWDGNEPDIAEDLLKILNGQEAQS